MSEHDVAQLRRLKILRQKRLREVGEAGQERLFAAQMAIFGEDLRAEVALRYVLGAGVHKLQLEPALWPLARALDPGAVQAEHAAPLPAAQVPEFLQDEGARAVFAGAHAALLALLAQLPEPPG